MYLTYMLRLNSHYNKYLAFRVKDAGEGESVFIINIVQSCQGDSKQADPFLVSFTNYNFLNCEIILDLQESCKNSVENTHKSFIQLVQPCTFIKHTENTISKILLTKLQPLLGFQQCLHCGPFSRVPSRIPHCLQRFIIVLNSLLILQACGACSPS